MTIFQLLNRSPFIPEVHIRVFNYYNDQLFYDGKYEDCTPYIFNKTAWDFEITEIETKEYNPGKYYIKSATIYADGN